MRTLHATLAFTSVSFFIIRASGRLISAAWLTKRWARTVPHLIDTLLLLMGVGLLIRLGLWPHQMPWLSAKLFALLGYIGLGMVAMKVQGSRWLVLAATLGALSMFAYMLSVAYSKQLWPYG